MALPGYGAYNGTTIWPQNKQQSGYGGGNASTAAFGGVQYGGGSNTYSAPQSQASGFGGGNALGGGIGSLAQGQTTGMFTNSQGNPQSTVNAGPRNMGSVNYNNVAAISSYLNGLAPAQRAQASQYLTQNGLMPTYNGTPIGQAGATALTPYVSSGTFGGMAGQYNGGSFANQQSSQDNMNEWAAGAQARAAMTAGGNPAEQAARAAMGMGGGQASNVSGYDPSGGIAGAMSSMNASGGAGGGYPLMNSMQSSIQGILDHPSPYSQEQTNMLRNRSTNGIDAQRQMATAQAQQDAARRGLSPQEAGGNLSAIGSNYDRQRQGVQSDFELNNATATRQGLLSGLSAGQGLTGLQMQDETSIMQYLALLGQNGGNAPLFVKSL